MTTTITASNGTDGVNGVVGTDSTDLDTPAGDGGDGTSGTRGHNATHTVTQADIDGGLTEIHLNGGDGGHGGDGNYAGQAFMHRDENLTGQAETWHDTYSPGGDGGNGGDGGDGGESRLSGSGLVAANGLKMVATAGDGGWGGTGFQGTAGASDYHQFIFDWMSVEGDGGVVTTSLDWTVDPRNGGLAGDGGDAGNSGDAVTSLKTSTVHGNVAIEAHGSLGNLAGWGGLGTGGGTEVNEGGDGGNAGNGGDATVIVDGNMLDFNQTAHFAAQAGSGCPGAPGGSGGYGLTIRDDNHTVTVDYVYGMGGDGGDGGDAGKASMTITDNHFTGTAADESLYLQISLSTGERGEGGRGGVSLDESGAHDGQSGDAGASGSAAFWFDGNVIDGGDGIDRLHLELFNQTWERSDDGSGLTNAGTITVDLEQGKVLIGEGSNTIQNVENIDFYYVNAYYDVANNIHYNGNAIVIGDDKDNVISGTFGNDSLSGGGGDDTLNGVGGMDVLYGGGGNDTYYYYRGQTVLEYADGGVDTMLATGTTTLADNVENLILLLKGNRYGTGNGLDNILTGNDGNNRLGGRDGNDTLIGGAGHDLMLGGAGNDLAYATDAGDVMREYGGQGFDVVKASVSFTLGTNVEELILTGSRNLSGQGSSGNNTLYGNRGNNWLNGGSGNDIIDGMAGTDKLTGGTGADIFRFSHGSGHDVIRDFSAAENDHINVHAYSGGEAWGGGIQITQDGSDTRTDFGDGNWVIVLNINAEDPGLLSHIVW